MGKNVNLNSYFYLKSEIDTFLNSKLNNSFGVNNARKNVVTDVNGNITTEDKPSIPEYTSELINNSGFLTQHQDISGKLDEAQGAINANKNVVTDSTGHITTEAKPTIPTKTSDLINNSGYITQNGLNGYVLKSSTSGLIRNDGTIDTNNYLISHQDISGKVDRNELSNVAATGSYNDLLNKPTIPSNTSDLTNDSGFLTDNNITIITDEEDAVDDGIYLIIPEAE